jgi:hypothetical protein
MKQREDYINKKGKIMKSCIRCRTQTPKKPKKNIYEGKTRCYRCQCWREETDFIKNDKKMMCCIKCRNLSQKFMNKKRQKELIFNN